jgi:hypothetical protein
MKVLNLKCELGHGFEGWFSDEQDYEQQLATKLLVCPLCESASITKLPSAPRLNLSGAKRGEGATSNSSHTSSDNNELISLPQSEQQRALLEAARQMMANTKDVGERFAEEARRMHYGEAAHEAIRGKASREEAVALREEGIEFMSMPLPAALKEPLQ